MSSNCCLASQHTDGLPFVSVAIFTSREHPTTLQRTIDAVLQSAKCWRSIIVDVLVNGNAELAQEISRLPKVIPLGSELRVWRLDQPDKATTWNTYLYDLAPDCDYSFFVDGYAEVERDSLCEMVLAHRARPDALAISGVQRLGPSAKRLLDVQLRRGGLCGNLYALPRKTRESLRTEGFRLPAGIYRNDSTLGAALCFGLDPSRCGWDANRILVVSNASFTYDTPRLWRPKDVRSFFKRTLRQAQGQLENSAVRDHFLVRKLPPHDLPSTAFDLVTEWMARNSVARDRLLLSPMTRIAYRNLLRKGPQRFNNVPPELLLEQRG